MKRYILKTAAVLAIMGSASCSGWLGEESPMLNKVEDYFTGSEAALQTVTAAYVPMMWEYNNTYYSEFFIGDVVSDDALKGGQNTSDMADAYDLENFKAIANNGLILEYYRAQYQGIARANLAIEQISAMEVGIDETFTQEYKDRLIAEAEFLRAFYYFRLVRMFGGVPEVTEPVYSSDDWIKPRATVDEIYTLITDDLESAQSKLPKKSAYAIGDLGRATSGAAQAMLLKAYLYWGNYKENNGLQGDADTYYEAAATWGRTFLSEQAGEYSLCPNYADNFTLDGENGPESVFEIQYMKEETTDYGEGNGFQRGTFATILMRSRSSAFVNVGWGFNRPTQNLYDEYEEGDPRRDETILAPEDDEISNPEQENYLGCKYVTLKRTMFDYTSRAYPEAIDNDMRSPINNIVIRLADVYLMYAEACLDCDDMNTAKEYLEKVRARARGSEDILPEFPDYQVPDYTNGYALHQLTDSEDDLWMAIRHERRVELAMESHRWFDLCRWGIAKDVMDAYKANESEQVRAQMGDFITGKHELFPIPDEEIRLGHLEQNPGY
ncbi:MAG: RagB/SusD family nutrient uptake outer membrane protein [Bacteroidetes bacterium]|uniref:RagB/SusD family nutrient uptake outer membrane protein n=1 Tax=Candidatus Cryptobacteroides intestinigallinarum TaxID=2840767 RepID=A0A9D9HKE8_9BACT|nr:RagB/SusD family nutrient uptake outer membrane protein [Candidatus Cryptobacteroides intestinigallinarum]